MLLINPQKGFTETKKNFKFNNACFFSSQGEEIVPFYVSIPLKFNIRVKFNSSSL